MEQLSKIMDAINSQAQAEVDEIMQKSTQRIVEIQHTFANEARLGSQAILNTAQRQADEILMRSESQASMQNRNMQLEARRQLMDRLFAQIPMKLAAADVQTRKAFYEKLIRKYCIGNHAVVQLNEDDLRKLGKKLKVKDVEISLDKTAGNFCGGLIIKEERAETDCTFEALVSGMQKELEPVAAAMIFPENEG